MTDLNLQVVREFFELNLFRVMTNWHQRQLTSPQIDHGPHFFVVNANLASMVPHREEEPGDDTLLKATDLGRIQHAVVEVCAWHSDRVYASVVEANPVMTEFAQPPALSAAKDFLGVEDIKTILVLSELPLSPERRGEALDAIRKAGIDHVIEFPTILQDLVEKVSLNGTYQGSSSLQFIQILKRYRMLRHQQMEFLFPTEPPVPSDRPPDGAGEVAYDEEREE